MKKNILLYIIFITFITSCAENTNEVLDLKANSSLFDSSEDEVIAIAKSFQESVIANTNTRTSNTTFDIKSKYRLDTSVKTRTSSADERLPLIYEIEMNDGLKNGKIIVSGDKRVPEVLAYIPSFNDSLYKVSPEPNVMIQMAKNALLHKIQNYNTAPLTRSQSTESVPGEVSVMIVPFCTTEWWQGNPYNQLLPKAWVEYAEGNGNILGCSLYENYKTGEAVVAIAQTMAYLQPHLTIGGTYIDWEALTTEKRVPTPYQSMAATLFKYIYDTIGTYPVWGKSYNDRWPQSASTIVDAVIAMNTPIANILKIINSSQCGMACDNVQDWNLNAVKKSITSLKPVLVGDLGRLAFLVDGYAINEENSAYLHCNFGRNGDFNGYFLVYDDGRVVFELNGLTFRDYNLKIITNIRNR